jgi:amino acid transporter
MGFGIRWIASAAAAGPASLPLWIAAVVGFMAPLVIVTAEMVGRHPGESGLYGWTRATLGPFIGFLTGWLYWTCNLPFFCGLLYFILAVSAAAIGPGGAAGIADPWVAAALACGLAVTVGALHLLGLGAGKWLTNVGAAAGLLLLAIVVAVGALLAARHGSATDFVHASYAPPLTADGAALWATMVFAFGGPEALAFLSHDVEGGVRQILKVLVVVGVLVSAAYIVGTVAMLLILPPEAASRLTGLPDALTLAFSRLGAPWAGRAALGLLGVCTLGGYSAWFGVAARLPFVIGVDHYFPSIFARRDPRTGAPTTAIVVQIVAILALVVLGQAGSTVKAAYDFLIAMSVLSYTLPFALLMLAYYRVRGPAPPGAWTAPGGAPGRRAIALAGLAVTLSAIACTLVPSPDATDKTTAVIKLIAASAVLIAGGVLIYARAVRRLAMA